MYNFIVDFFKSPREGTQARKRVNKLLAWWNKYVTLHFTNCVGRLFIRKIFPNHTRYSRYF
jgi:hypothetical protein